MQTAVFTRRGCERIIRAAFEGARRRRRKVTSITKSNAQIFGMVLWDEVFKSVALDYPDVATESLLVDAAAMDFVRRPESFDVVVASNLFGDILTDLSAIVTGSVGLAASGNINPERRYPEHVRAGSRLGARHCRQRNRQPAGRDPVRRDAPRSPGIERAPPRFTAPSLPSSKPAAPEPPTLAGPPQPSPSPTPSSQRCDILLSDVPTLRVVPASGDWTRALGRWPPPIPDLRFI